MPCYRPLKGHRLPHGTVKVGDVAIDVQAACEDFELGCGRCVGCRLTRASSWAVRCTHEAELFQRNSFVTLTYNDEHLPENGSLRYEDVQKFWKRFRKSERGFEAGPSGKYPVRYFVAGEYGEKSWRAHYHALLFNYDFADRRYWRTSETGDRIYRSELAESLWSVDGVPMGNVELGSVTPRSTAYVARYSMKKVLGRQAATDFYSWVDEHTGEVCEVKPEFCAMSLKPGIGAWWYERYRSDVFPRDQVVGVGGEVAKVPRYYAERLKLSDPLAFEEIQQKRIEKLREMPLDERTARRRAAQEAVAVARLAHFQGERSF